MSEGEARDMLDLALLCRVENAHILEAALSLSPKEAEEVSGHLDLSKLLNRNREVARPGRAGYRSNIPSKSLEDRLLAFHDSVGHMEAPQMEQLLKRQEAAGVKCKFGVKAKDVKKWKSSWCPVCARCKTTNTSYPKVSKRPPSTHSNQLWFTDTHGPDNVVNLHGYKYHQVMVDDYDDLNVVYNMCDRTEDTMMLVLEMHESWAEIDSRKFPNYSGVDIPVKAYFSDQAGEIAAGKKNRQRMAEKRIELSTTVHDSSVIGNGKAERAIRKLKTVVKMLLLARRLPLALAGYGWLYAAYLDNRRPKKRFSGFSSYERRYHKPVDWSRVRPFGCEVVVNVKNHRRRQNQSQYDPSGEVRIFVGIAPNNRGWLCYNPRTQRITAERNCIFQEDADMQVVRPLADYFAKWPQEMQQEAEWSSGDEERVSSGDDPSNAAEARTKAPDEGNAAASANASDAQQEEEAAEDETQWELEFRAAGLDSGSNENQESDSNLTGNLAAAPAISDPHQESDSNLTGAEPEKNKREIREAKIADWKADVVRGTAKHKAREEAKPPRRSSRVSRPPPLFSQRQADEQTHKRVKNKLKWADGLGPAEDGWKGRYYLKKDESYQSIAMKTRVPTQDLIVMNQEYHKTGGKVGKPIVISSRHVKTVDKNPDVLTYLWVPTDRGWVNHPTKSPTVEEIENDPLMDDTQHNAAVGAEAETSADETKEGDEPEKESKEEPAAAEEPGVSESIAEEPEEKDPGEHAKAVEEAAWQMKRHSLREGVRQRALKLRSEPWHLAEDLFDHVGPRNRKVDKEMGRLIDKAGAMARQMVKEVARTNVSWEDQKQTYERAFALFDLAHEVHYCRVVEELEREGIKARDVPEPKRYSQAVEGRFKQYWTASIQKELANLKNHGVYRWVHLKPGQKTVDAKWVFKVKSRNDGGIDKFKSRLVARGFRQIYQQDFIETHAPVTVLTSFRACLAEAARYGYGVKFFDISGAYLEADLVEEVFIEPPPGVVPPEPGMVWHLLKALYGLCQAGRAWNRTLHNKLIDSGYEAAEGVDHCLYTKTGEGTLRINVHVDDCCCTFDKKEHFEKLLADLNKEGWNLSASDDDNRFLGMEVEHLPGGAIALHQRGYIREILETFGMADCKAADTPQDSGKKHTKDDCPKTAADIEAMRKVPYRSAIGKLRYLADGTRPDIAAILGILSQFLCNPGRAHWDAVKKIIRYLKGTQHHGLVWGQNTDGVPHIPCATFSDASWADDPDDRTSRLGYITFSWGGPIGWKSKKEKSQSLSSTQAEYQGACMAAREVVWARRLFAHLGYDMEELSIPSYGELTEAEYQGAKPCLIFEDNTGAIAMSKNPIKHGRNKHIELKYHFVRQKVAEGEVKLTFVPSEENVADALTKQLGPKKFVYFRDKTVKDFRVNPEEKVSLVGDVKWWYPYAPIWRSAEGKHLAKKCGVTVS